MVYLTGDTHGEVYRFSPEFFPDQEGMTRDDAVIILGDFGVIWDKPSIIEKEQLEFLDDRPFTTCFIDGNHDGFDRLYSDEFEVVDFHGGKAHKIRDNVYHLMRGYVFDFDGKKFFAFGGARSHDIGDGILDRSDFSSDEAFKNTLALYIIQDKMFRINHESWWEQELPSQEEMDRGEHNLEAVNYKVDYVITHCLPQTVASVAGYFGKDILTEYFDNLLDKGLQFQKWYCGHYHEPAYYLSKYEVFANNIARII